MGMLGRVCFVMWESGGVKGGFGAAEQYENCQSRGWQTVVAEKMISQTLLEVVSLNGLLHLKWE